MRHSISYSRLPMPLAPTSLFGALLPLLLGLLTPLYSPAAQEGCLPIASASVGAEHKDALPLICAPRSARDELLTYVNIAEVYRLNPESESTRFVDQVELSPDIAENEYVIGNGKSILRLNSFLRIRDARLFIENIKSRLKLVSASAETDKLLKDLALASTTVKLNIHVSLQNFLDAPFLGSSGQVIAAAPSTDADGGLLLGSNTTDPVIVPQERSTASNAGLLASSNFCDNLKLALTTRREAYAKELTDLATAKSFYTAAIKRQPGAGLISALNKKRPVALAKKEESSECDQCFEAVHYCKAKGLLPGFTPTKNNCRSVNSARACTNHLPASLMAPVEVCYGGASIRRGPTALNRWSKREDELTAKIAKLDAVLGASGAAGCTDPEAVAKNGTKDEAEAQP